MPFAGERYFPAARMIPLRDENPSSTVPFVTRLLIAINLAVFAYELMLGPTLQPFVMECGLVPERGTLALASAMSGGIAFWAHIGGFAFGALAMLVLGGGGRRSYARIAE